VKKPKPRSVGVSATEHGRAQAIVDQLQARVEELEGEVEVARGAIDPGQAGADVATALTTLIAVMHSAKEGAPLVPDDGSIDPDDLADLCKGLDATVKAWRKQRRGAIAGKTKAE
jgi:hypothetical protein